MKEYTLNEKVASSLNDFFNGIQDEDNTITAYSEGDKCQCADRIMKQPGNEIYHSRDYKRAGKSCSSIVQCFSSSNHDDLIYGDIQMFLIVDGQSLALVKPFNQYVSTICQIEINLPDDDIVRQLAANGLLGAHHIPIDAPDDNELLIIPCTAILAKCVLVETSEANIFGYLTPVIDYICK